MLYEFKINLEPVILNLYTAHNSNYAQGMNQIKKELLPKLFKKVFHTTESINQRWMLVSRDESVDILETNSYKSFKTATDVLISNYFNVVAEFERSKSIQYSADFLSNVKPKAKEAIDDLLKAFPEISFVLDWPNKEFSEDLNNDVGHGKSYIITARKIDKYLENNPNSVKLRAYYNFDNERILIDADDQNRAKAVKKNLEKLLNSQSEDMSLGVININPVFESYEVIESHKKVYFHFVYPNGLPSDITENAFDRYSKYQHLEKIDYAQLDVVVTASENKQFSAEDIESVGKEDARYGYLKNVSNGNKSIVKTIVKKYKDINEADENEKNFGKGRK